MLEEQNQIGIIFSCIWASTSGSRLIWYIDCADFGAANADETCGNGCIWPVATVFLVETESAEQRVPHTKKGPQMWIKMSEHKRKKKKKSMHFYLPEAHDWFCCGGLAC